MINNDYNILGINEHTSITDIKTIYRKLLLKHHPDKGGDSEKFKEIHDAYNRIINNTSNSNSNSFSFYDIFKFNGQKTYETIFLTLEELYNGKKISVIINDCIFCEKCDKKVCTTCDGIGKIKKEFSFVKNLYIKCNICNGDGYIRNGCTLCNWSGEVYRETTFDIKIKKGQKDNDKIPIKNTDVILTIKEIKHPRFIRYEHDLILVQEMNFIDILNGGPIIIKHLNKTSYKIQLPEKEVIQPDMTYIVKSLGMPNYKDRIYGNLYIEIILVLPRILSNKLTNESIEILKNILNIKEKNKITSTTQRTEN